MEAEAAAIREILTKLDEVEELMDVITMVDFDNAQQRIGTLRRAFTARLREHELALWSLAGLPEVPRASR